jgi:hypothetical protein
MLVDSYLYNIYIYIYSNLYITHFNNDKWAHIKRRQYENVWNNCCVKYNTDRDDGYRARINDDYQLGKGYRKKSVIISCKSHCTIASALICIITVSYRCLFHGATSQWKRDYVHPNRLTQMFEMSAAFCTGKHLAQRPLAIGTVDMEFSSFIFIFLFKSAFSKLATTLHYARLSATVIRSNNIITAYVTVRPSRFHRPINMRLIVFWH